MTDTKKPATPLAKHMVEPCKQCPFSRDSVPGRLGGSTPEVFIGQIAGPFVLPCHMHCDFDDPHWRDDTFTTPQCAGAAIFRTHVGVADQMPEAIHRLPANHEKVLSSYAEFLAHHKQIRLTQAIIQLAIEPVSILLSTELRKSGIMHFAVKKPEDKK